jgi:hypothetical protein
LASGSVIVFGQIGGDALPEFGGRIAFRLLSAVAFQYGLQLRALDTQGAGEVARDPGALAAIWRAIAIASF